MKKLLQTLVLAFSLLVFSVGVFADSEPGHIHTGKVCFPPCPMYGGELADPQESEHKEESYFDRLFFIGKIILFY